MEFVLNTQNTNTIIIIIIIIIIINFNICKEIGVQLDKKHCYEHVPK